MTRKDIAIIGGTFNPVHNGHIDMINYLVDNYIVDEVWVLPSYISPHKNLDGIAPFEDRVNMLNLATSNIKNTLINTFEKEFFENNDAHIEKTYTYEVLEALKKKYLNGRFHFVVGFDSIKHINEWHRYKELIRDYWFYIFDREDDEFNEKSQKIRYLDNLGKNFNVKFIYELFDTKITNISSTEIRSYLKDIDANAEILSKYLDKNVIQYIKEHSLYK